MQVFEKVLMASEDVKSYLGTGVYRASDENAEIFDGALVTVGALMDHDAYAGMKDINVRTLGQPTAITDPVCIVDYVGVSEAMVNGVLYRVGDSATCC